MSKLKMILTINALEHLKHFFFKKEDMLTTKQVATFMQMSTQFVRNAIKDGRLKAHILPGRSTEEGQERKTYLIPKNAVIIFVLHSSNFSPEECCKHFPFLMLSSSTEPLDIAQDEIEHQIKCFVSSKKPIIIKKG